MKEALRKKKKIEELRKRRDEAVDEANTSMSKAGNMSNQMVDNVSPRIQQNAKRGADALQESVNVASYGEDNYKETYSDKKKKKKK